MSWFCCWAAALRRRDYEAEASGATVDPVADAVEVQPIVLSAPVQPAPVQSTLGQTGSAQPTLSQQGSAQSPLGQPGSAQPTLGQQGSAQSPPSQPGSAYPNVGSNGFRTASAWSTEVRTSGVGATGADADQGPTPAASRFAHAAGRRKRPAPRGAPKPMQARPTAAKVNAPVIAVVLHPSAPQPQVGEPAPAPQAPATPAVAPSPASPEPEQVTPAKPQASAAPFPQPHQVTLNAGLTLPVRLVDGLSSERNGPGDTFAATLDKEVVVDGFVIAERGARVEGRVVAVDRAKVRSSAALALELTALHTSDGQTVPILTDSYFKHADPRQVNNTAKIAGGAVIGAVIGALAGGGKGAAIGAGVGGGAGVGDVLLTRRPLEMASESVVTFRLRNAVPLTEHLQ